MVDGLDIDLVDGTGGAERDALVSAFRLGTLDPTDLTRLRFRLGPDGEWREHPQVRFLHLPVEPSTPVDGPELVWQQRVHGSPCGVLEIWHRFDWGRKVDSAIGLHTRPAVISTIAYDLVLRVMEGELSPEGAAERGAEVEGDFAAMRQLVKVFAQPEFVAATRDAVGPLGPALRSIAPPRR